MDLGQSRFNAVVKERNIELPLHGSWDTALVIEGNVPPHRPNRDFLRLLASANPDLTGWPVWLDSSDFSTETSRPYLMSGRWEALIFSGKGSDRGGGHLDFWMLDPKGTFFLRRALQDDVGGRNPAAEMKTLEPKLATLRVGEALAVGQAFARAMGCAEGTVKLSLGFRWTKLKGRSPIPWASPMHIGRGYATAHQDEAESTVVLPFPANDEAICLATHEAILPLMSIFGGYEPHYESTRGWITRLLTRKL